MIEKKVLEILNQNLNIEKDLLVVNNFKEPLTGKIFRFDYRKLMYLLFFIEKEFDIKIEERYLLKDKFNSINGIISIINIHS